MQTATSVGQCWDSETWVLPCSVWAGPHCIHLKQSMYHECCCLRASSNTANMNVLGKVKSTQCRYRALLFALTVQGIGPQSCKMEIVLTHPPNNKAKDFLKVPASQHCGIADHIPTMGLCHLHRQHQKQLLKDASVWGSQESPCLPGKIRVTTFQQNTLRGYWISEILYLRNIDGRWCPPRHQCSIFQSSGKVRAWRDWDGTLSGDLQPMILYRPQWAAWRAAINRSTSRWLKWDGRCFSSSVGEETVLHAEPS